MSLILYHENNTAPFIALFERDILCLFHHILFLFYLLQNAVKCRIVVVRIFCQLINLILSAVYTVIYYLCQECFVFAFVSLFIFYIE